jgi:L-histidine N-alpha-methyltransferase
MTPPLYRLDVHTDEAEFLGKMADDVRRGLTERPRWLPPKYFYDEAGGQLFDRITELPEYYLTRAEESILREIAPALIGRVRPDDFVELGPGSCHKVRFMLDALPRRDGTRYVAVDVGRDGLVQAVARLADDYPALDVHAVVGDFERHLAHVPPPAGRRLGLFLGSTIGNFPVVPRRALLTELGQLLGADGRLLLGVDLVKDRRVLEAAYDDAAGVTRDFNRNVLRHLNHALDGDFVPEAFRHHAVYDVEAARIEMHLIAEAPQRVRLERLDLTVDFDEGEGIWTESSYKFTRESTEAMLAEAGLALEEWHTDQAGQFGLVLARPAS